MKGVVFILSIANLSVAKVGRILYNYFINNKEGYIMKYMGSKNRIAKHLIPIMIAEADKRGITTTHISQTTIATDTDALLTTMDMDN